jgi:hypothetical protein
MRIAERIRRASIAALAAGIVTTAAGGPASAADPMTPADVPPPGAELPPRAGARPARAAAVPPPVVASAPPRPIRPPGAWFVSVGPRISLIRGAGYDPFSTNDVLAQFSATGLHSFASSSRLSTAVGLQWDAGSAQADARGANASLSLSRVAAVVEERFVPRPWLYAFGRLAPGWLFASASLDDASTVARLESSYSSFCLDASGGLAGRLNPGPQPVGVWFLAESGYGWAPAHSLGLAPALPAADKDKAGVTPLADLAPRGAFFRFSIAMDF